jgi:hypothetical protein
MPHQNGLFELMTRQILIELQKYLSWLRDVRMYVCSGHRRRLKTVGRGF